MKHHEPLIAMRRRGRKPSAVFLEVDCCVDSRWWERDKGSADIAIEPTDAIARLDLRFLVGCSVHVLGRGNARLRQAFNAAVAAGAAHVLTVIDEELCIHG